MDTFLRQLTETGHVSVRPFGAEAAPEPDPGWIAEADRRQRLEFPGEAPALSLPAARWAAATFYRACQLLVCRDVPAAEVTAALAGACPQARSPEAHYSVDLVLRRLPDLLAAARRLAAGDPLVDALLHLAREWPLSSVGVPGLEPEKLSEVGSLVAHPGLRQLYADRILQHEDTGRAGPPAVRAAVLASLGQHVETLGPRFASLPDAAPSASLPRPA
ncbi:MAG: hypothetical protein INR65_20895 [Gluconacetobacter diazotrophicus]|nr:hypothetical protein [Gluconacetobacter diazotrophicus]